MKRATRWAFALVAVRIRGWAPSCSEVAVPRQAQATWEQPLGDRTLVDGACQLAKYSARPDCADK